MQMKEYSHVCNLLIFRLINLMILPLKVKILRSAFSKKILGITINNSLITNNLITNICKKLKSLMLNLVRSIETASKQTLVQRLQ